MESQSSLASDEITSSSRSASDTGTPNVLPLVVRWAILFVLAKGIKEGKRDMVVQGKGVIRVV